MEVGGGTSPVIFLYETHTYKRTSKAFHVRLTMKIVQKLESLELFH